MAISQGFIIRSGSSGYSFAAFSRKRAANPLCRGAHKVLVLPGKSHLAQGAERRVKPQLAGLDLVGKKAVVVLLCRLQDHRMVGRIGLDERPAGSLPRPQRPTTWVSSEKARSHPRKSCEKID